jgi:hypothetical protein
LALVLRKEITMYDNYPPGVTGREYEIAGPDDEFETDYFCPVCGSTQTGFMLTYSNFSWFNCGECDTDTDVSYEDALPRNNPRDNFYV